MYRDVHYSILHAACQNEPLYCEDIFMVVYSHEITFLFKSTVIIWGNLL